MAVARPVTARNGPVIDWRAGPPHG